VLTQAGYVVLEAANGDEAERVFAKHAGAVDVLVTDVVMPGCGGPELLGRLRAHTPALPVLFMSGYTDRSTLQETGIDAGVPFVQKPFTAISFLQKVRETLKGRNELNPDR
jgi:DNA-binding NtrC family response regulator